MSNILGIKYHQLHQIHKVLKTEIWSEEDKYKIIFRFTALWAFIESGVGGLLHILQLPFSGVFLTGCSILIISLIYVMSDFKAKEVFKSLSLVLIIKLALSPQTPFTAYIAVSFQAVISLVIYYFFNVNFISILFISLLTYWESAFQKVIVLTILFGKNLYQSIDEFVNKYIGNLFPILHNHASFYLLSVYFLVYTLAALAMAFIIHRSIKILIKGKGYLEVIKEKEKEELPEISEDQNNFKTISYFKILLAVLLFLISIMYFIADVNKLGHYLAKTLFVFIVWFFVFIPFFKYCIILILKKKQTELKTQYQDILNFFPRIKLFTIQAYMESKDKSGFNKLNCFFERLILLIIFK